MWLFNHTFGTNYLFLNAASPHSPLAWILTLTGETWYLPGYALFGLAVMVVMLLPWAGNNDAKNGSLMPRLSFCYPKFYQISSTDFSTN